MKTNLARLFFVFITGVFVFLFPPVLKTQILKSIVYDFDGFDLNQTSIPEGEYSYGDMSYKITANPLAASDVLGDRVLQLNVNWNNGYAAFGRGISRYIEFDVSQDLLNFFIYNPVSNNQSATIELIINEDDNQSNAFESASDDSWRKNLNIASSAGWQLVSVPLKDFTDSNTGGNGIFDMAFTQNQGMLLLVELRFNKASPGLSNAVFYVDMICFTDGSFPHGNTILDLPSTDPGDYCPLGAFQPEPNGNNHLIPVHFEALFPTLPGRKLKYVNTYMQFATNGSTVANNLPSASIQTLMNNGYIPIITWEPMFYGYGPLDPVQPKLQNIINGDYNSYIDLFADKVKTFSDTLIIRLMHEFEGDWYSWCISQNGQDPTKFALAYQKVVDRFKNKGVTNVLWMWCGNSDYAPYQSYNWMVKAYPGNAYVDLVATDIYNGHYPASQPWWRSFRWIATESYYYLRKYFPSKPAIVCELGCRERQSTEDVSSETKAGWYAGMDKELQSNFRKFRGLIFFNSVEGQDWTVNTSASSLQSLRDNVWYDDYYFVVPVGPLSLPEKPVDEAFSLFPNPSKGSFSIRKEMGSSAKYEMRIADAAGKIVADEVISFSENEYLKTINRSELFPGLYMVELRNIAPENSIRGIYKLLVE